MSDASAPHLNPDSKFAIVGIRMPASSTRAATGTIGPIDNGAIVRMGDGRKRDLTRASGRLFAGTIRTSDVWPLPLSGTWKGSILDIDYPGELIEPIGTPQQRPAVPGTLFHATAEMVEVPQADPPSPRAVFRVYCPRLHVMVMTP